MVYENKEFCRIDSVKVNSVNLLENLGEVDYIFSDKTGTLTKNELTLKEIYVPKGENESEKASVKIGLEATASKQDIKIGFEASANKQDHIEESSNLLKIE